MQMNFSEKLQLLRRSKGYTQEHLAEALHVSRQAVAKWEAGMAYPDISNLLLISDLLHVTVDYLVRDQDCGLRPVPSEPKDVQEIIHFRLAANRQTYAACMNESEPTRLDSHDYHYTEGAYAYHDTYVGGERFAGEEAVWCAGRAVYAMNYMGRVLGENFSGNFLKEALRAANEDMPYRGPQHYQAGEYTYLCKVTGDIAWFQGYEEIFWRQVKVYECCFHGGLLK